MQTSLFKIMSILLFVIRLMQAMRRQERSISKSIEIAISLKAVATKPIHKAANFIRVAT
jgi:hypothetical protein